MNMVIMCTVIGERIEEWGETRSAGKVAHFLPVTQIPFHRRAFPTILRPHIFVDVIRMIGSAELSNPFVV